MVAFLSRHKSQIPIVNFIPAGAPSDTLLSLIEGEVKETLTVICGSEVDITEIIASANLT